MSIQDTKLKTFVKKGGYEVVKQIKRGKRKGQWKNISEAARVTGLSRPTIYKILEEHPEKPSKVEPKYVKTLEESAGFKSFMQIYGKKLKGQGLTTNITYLKKAFSKLEYKAPETWTEDDYKKLWYDPDFHSEACKGIDKRIAIYFRRMMRATDNHPLLDKLKYKAPPDGKKKNWFLHDDEIKRLVANIEDPEVLLLLFAGIPTGGRHSALNGLKAKHVDFYDHTIQVFEKKTGDHVTKYPPLCVFDLLKIYIEDRNLAPEDPLFPHNYNWHLSELNKAGKRAKLTKNVSTHIMKHTFVTQARRHRVSAEVIVEMTGTEMRTIEKYYTGKDEAKIRFEMQGRDYKATPFHEWYAGLTFYFRARYSVIRGA